MDWSRCDDIEYDNQYENSMFHTDNPNYFDIDSISSPAESRSNSGIFTFRKRTSSSNKSPQPSTIGIYNNIDGANLGKRRSSLRNLWRSRSNSASIHYTKDNKNQNQTCRNAPVASTSATNTINFRSRLESHDEGQNDETDDVFYTKASNSDHKFFSLSHQNASSTTRLDGQHRRRHSLGTFATKDKICTTSFIDEAPQEFAPQAPMLVSQKRRVVQPRDHSIGNASMDDILIVTTRLSEISVLWVNYIQTCFNKITAQRGRMSFNFLHVKIDDDELFDTELIQRCHATKLQIVIICPLLIGLDNGMVKQRLSQILKTDRTVGMLLDLKESQVLDIHRDVFPSYNKWRKCVVRDHDQSFVSNFLGIAQDILGRALRQRPFANDALTLQKPPQKNGTTNGASAAVASIVSGKNHDNFTVIPKKIKAGQNKATVMLTDALEREDFIKVRIEKIGHSIEITNIKRRNPFTIHFTVPDCCTEISMMIGIRIFKNNIDLGVRPIKCESRLKELEQILKSSEAPMEFMCQSLGLSTADSDKLDLYVVQSFQRNIPPNFHLLSSPHEQMRLHKEASPEEYPTLLHFAARWGLERLGLLLLECPGAEMAVEVRSASGKSPADIAELYGHTKIASSFRNFSKMNEFTTMYHYFKGISEESPEKSVIELKSMVVAKDFPPTEECTNDSYPTTHYLVMKSNNESDNNNNDIHENSNAIANLSYLNVDHSDFESIDTVDAPSSFNPMMKRDSKDLINNLNNMKIKEEDEKEITNELKITEESYYDSNEFNKSSNNADDFSNTCSDVLENVSQADSTSLTPSTNSIPSSNSDNQQQALNNGDYLIQPSNRPVTGLFFSDYLTHPSNRPVTTMELNENMQHDYMNQSMEQKPESSHARLYFKKKKYESIGSLNSHTTSKSINSNGTLKRNDSDASSKKSVKSVDDELLEIINDFKNNVFTINEVEELVGAWKNRNDVKKSFSEKQEQLQRMREEYEKIQQRMKDNLKRPSPFERMKRIFTRKQEKVTQNLNLPLDLTGSNANFRPNSTLSLHSASSNSSSGRMSTSSQASVCDRDSGRDSDEERRNLNQHSNNINLKINQSELMMDNYLIPPSNPRPVLLSTPLSTPIDDKRSLSFSLSAQSATSSSEHYILFPSNLPVFQSKSNENSFSTFKGKK